MEEKEKATVIEEENDDEMLNPDDFDEVDEEEDEEETEEGESEETESEDDKKEKEKERAKNAKAAERRRAREAREAKIREEAALKAELGILKVNPYTDEPIDDEEDLKIYKLQKELDEEGRDPINDLPKKIAEKNRKAVKDAKAEEEKTKQEETARQEKINAEIRELRAKYPKVNTAELAVDPLFQKCLEGRAGRWSQVEIYELYLREKADQEKKKAEEVAKEKANKVSNPPSAAAKGNSPQKTIEDMTPEEFERYFNEKYS